MHPGELTPLGIGEEWPAQAETVETEAEKELALPPAPSSLASVLFCPDLGEGTGTAKKTRAERSSKGLLDTAPLQEQSSPLTHTHEDRGGSTKTGQKCSHQGHLQKQKGCWARDAVPKTEHRNPQERSVSHTQRKSSIGPQKVFNLLSHTQEGAGLE